MSDSIFYEWHLFSLQIAIVALKQYRIYYDVFKM